MTDKTEAVQRMQDYINAHFTQSISLAALAEAAHFSPWYASRIFKELTGLSPADYIRKVRLSKSALRLRDESVKIIDVALDSGFASVDGYQRAFYREFNCKPKEYAQHPVPLSLFTLYSVKFRELWKKEKTTMTQVKNVFIQVVEKPARKVILKRGVKAEEYWSYCQEVGCDVWGTLVSIKSLCAEPVCLWLPEKYRQPNTSVYVQGAEVPMDFDGEIPAGFEVIILPAAKYLMFQGEPFVEEEYCEAIQAVQQAMDRYDPSVIGYRWNAESPRIQLEPVGTRGYIKLKAVENL